MPTSQAVSTTLTEQDLYLFNEGTHFRLYNCLGARPVQRDGKSGVAFAVWAPNAEEVSVVGDFNHWQAGRDFLSPVGESGIWSGFLTNIGVGGRYKYAIRSKHDNYQVQKADPFGFRHEEPPKTASVVASLDYTWGDQAWMANRQDHAALDKPVSIYEVHLGSWARDPGNPEAFLSYRELAERLPRYVAEMGFTHVELMPVMEHPFYGSWGYQGTGYFAPSSRFGTPADFMHLVDAFHRQGIGVILDWVPSHFSTDEHGLTYFDGTHLFEHADRRQGFHPDWGSYIFNYGRKEVQSFLLSSAACWLDKYHIDGIRVDAVASMLYLDYSRNDGEWIPNEHGGRENLEAIHFLRSFNEMVFREFPGVQTYAEESTSWPMVSRPTSLGGLGFGYKWDMGWMHDTLRYFRKDPVYRSYHHNDLTFRSVYAFNENFALPLSHDEVVHGKGALINKMPGDEWQKFANLRLLLTMMYCQPGKKLLFMGAELAQWKEWNHDTSLDWHLLDHAPHKGAQSLLRDLNRLYATLPALHERDTSGDGFDWINAGDAEGATLAFLRFGEDGAPPVAALFNLTPRVVENYRIGVPCGGRWQEALNSDAGGYGGANIGNHGGVEALPVKLNHRPYSLTVTLPPLGALILTPES